ncbi:hypothetical protein B6S12_05445 [Helicobacter valdiviensis]|uniref:Lipoprotein n=1 Tax=Helicobacter valdiviensis TaxID=1458358 RepID=A0A2W6NL60_9HELI|nr:hypothetical protein B6S12_05445 [Helicobacter valdiviensis]
MVSYLNWRKLLIYALKFLGVAFLVFGCAKAPQKLEQTSSTTIFFSINQFKFYDLGFIKKYPTKTTLEIFNMGHLLFTFSASNTGVCLNDTCYSKEIFIRRFFKNEALGGLNFKDILEGKEILGGEGKEKQERGFIQKIQKGNNKIFYEVSKNRIYFKESQSKFTLEINYN